MELIRLKVSFDPARKGLQVRGFAIVEGTHTLTRTRTRESPKLEVGIEGERDLGV